MWCPYAKGGEYNPYWGDLHLLVNWLNNGNEIKSYTYPTGKQKSVVRNESYYYKMGLTYPERTTSDWSPRVLPMNSIFSVKGQAIFFEDEQKIHSFLLSAYTRGFKFIIDTFFGSGDASVSGSAAKDYRSGLINELPLVDFKNSFPCVKISLEQIKLNLIISTFYETSSYFNSVFTITPKYHLTLLDHFREFYTYYLSNRLSSLTVHYSYENIVHKFLGFEDESLKLIDNYVGPHPISYKIYDEKDIKLEVSRLWQQNEYEIIKECVEKLGARRQITKKSFLADRKLELISHLLQCNPQSIIDVIKENNIYNKQEFKNSIKGHLSYYFGGIWGRWNFDKNFNNDFKIEDLNPFNELPTRAPGRLTETDIYSFSYEKDSILVDEENNELDVIKNLRKAIEYLWKENTSLIEDEIIHYLEINSLRNYFQNSNNFFDDHLKAYSKSRRKAPIYWPLSTSSESYTLWIYYDRLNDQTIYKCLNNFIEPKINSIIKSLDIMNNKLNTLDKIFSRQEFDNLNSLLNELKEMKVTMQDIINLPYKPNLNDGVLIKCCSTLETF